MPIIIHRQKSVWLIVILSDSGLSNIVLYYKTLAQFYFRFDNDHDEVLI